MFTAIYYESFNDKRIENGNMLVVNMKSAQRNKFQKVIRSTNVPYQ